MRYKVEFDSEITRWLVIDTVLANQQMGVHVSKLAALQQAAIEENRWLTYDPLCSGIPPWDAPVPAETESPFRRSGLRFWARWPGRGLVGRRGCVVADRQGTPSPGAVAEGTR